MRALDAPVSRRETGTQRGLTLIELLLGVTLLGIVTALVVPMVANHVREVRTERARAEIRGINTEILAHLQREGELPATLEDLEPRRRTDPWGHQYRYLPFTGPGWRAEARKDRFLVPINTLFDLYSVGPDGESRPPLQAGPSLDDVVMANDGGWIGVAAEF